MGAYETWAKNKWPSTQHDGDLDAYFYDDPVISCEHIYVNGLRLPATGSSVFAGHDYKSNIHQGDRARENAKRDLESMV